MRWISLAFALMLAGALQVPAAARDKPDEGITTDIIVNYGSAYKDGTWVPVDVFVDNRDFDISGWVEVRTFSGPSAADERSPRYRVRAESPRNSRKRFRLYCRLEGTARVEAMLYHGNRSALDIPAGLGVEPIETDALLGLILDEEAMDFGFLYNVAPGGGGARRFHRESLNNDRLSLLADHVECYRPFDLIVMGDIDPRRVSARHREILREYVRGGGVLVVCTGTNGMQYRGTWVEGLLEVEIGQSDVWNEADLAKAVFPEDERAGARSDRECALTELVPASSGVKSRGAGRTVATIRPIGSGYAATIAVDASSRALQGCVGYRKLWRELFLLRSREGELNLKAASETCISGWPQVIGVTIASKSSVLVYLSLYVGIGIIANWFVCSLLRRRELAWVFLAVFSVGFTAYAMVFGTEGRAKSGELEQFDILHLPGDGGRARLYSLVGLISSRTVRYSMDLAREGALVQDATPAPLPWSGRSSQFWVRPFRFVQSAPGRIEDFIVGASELRLVRVDTDVSNSGRVEGQLVLDEKGLNGVLVNKTGYTIPEPYVILDGHIYRATADGQSWNVSINKSRLNRDAIQVPQNPYGYYGYGGQPTGSIQDFKKNLIPLLLSDKQSPGSVDGSLGPFLCGWTTSPCVGSVTLDRPVREGAAQGLLVVAGIEVVRESAGGLGPYPLSVEISEDYRIQRPYGGNVSILIPSWLARRDPDEIVVEVSASVTSGSAVPFSVFRDGQRIPMTDVLQETAESKGDLVTKRTVYRLTNWRTYYDDAAGRIHMVAAVPPRPDLQRGAPRREPGRSSFEVSAWAILKSDDGEESRWR